ncbi:GNAT family N-acetyltransferase [Aureisphaera galaxeae]|uniref:GNAT family N-acetyltransferase n=1 Tax=Aureisphaera galaxeae TaxID=1538023 RepID=UPI0023500434|nr:GNAT family N-acetyltransferase [Aureisphaera galaxeae]MDC8003062.1 GNAT family N-acetyltransferase [Aureisphaera galaxeae]
MWPKYLETRETERLIIRPLTNEDVEPWIPYIMDEEATAYFPIEWKLSPEKSQEWIDFQLKRYAESRYGLQALIEKESGQLIGQCGLLAQKVDDIEELEIGYHLLPEFWGKGYASEAAQFFKKLAFENQLTTSIISIIDLENTPSIKVAERNGMRREKQTTYYDMDVYVYRIHEEDFKNSLKP